VNGLFFEKLFQRIDSVSDSESDCAQGNEWRLNRVIRIGVKFAQKIDANHFEISVRLTLRLIVFERLERANISSSFDVLAQIVSQTNNVSEAQIGALACQWVNFVDRIASNQTIK
jgi:hypothetical protein